MSSITGRAQFNFIRYANCWEDPRLLLRALDGRQCRNILSIASAGDNSFSLLLTNPAQIVAVDLNQAQLDLVELKKAAIKTLPYDKCLAFLGFSACTQRKTIYAELRQQLSSGASEFWDKNQEGINAGIIHQGKFEKYLRFFATRLLPLVHKNSVIKELLRTKNNEEQEIYYQRHFDSWRWKLLFRLFFNRFTLGKFGRDPAFLTHVKTTVWKHIYLKASQHLSNSRCQYNSILQYNLTGSYNNMLPHYMIRENYQVIRERLHKLVLLRGYAEDAVKVHGPFDAMNLSNIFEYLSEDEFRSTAAKLVHGLSSGGLLLYWNLMVHRRISSDDKNVEYLKELSSRLSSEDMGFFYDAFTADQKK